MQNRAVMLGLMLLALTSTSCASDNRTLVIVNIHGDLGTSKALHLSAKVAGFRADQEVAVSQRFAVWLPENARGQLVLDVNALQGDGCSLAAGTTTATAGIEPSIEVSVTLAPWSLPYCPVEVEKSGPGSVVLRAEGVVDTCDTPSLLATTCTTFIPTGGTATLSAVPEPRGFFTGWSGDCTQLIDCSLRMDRPRKVGARFTSNLLAVNILSGAGQVTSEGGEIDCGKQCSATLPSGTRIKLTAKPESQEQTLLWSGACSGSSPVCEVVLNGPTPVGVRFVPYGITINRLGGDQGGTVKSDLPGISCGTTCSAAYPKGTLVTLTASPISGFFAGWPLPCASTGPTCTLTVDSAIQLTVPFITQSPCVAGATCWHNPLPQGNSLTRIWASQSAGTWASGGAGTVLRWDSDQKMWGLIKLPTDSAMNGIFGTSAKDLWVVGAKGEIWHFDGTSFTQSPSGVSTNLNAVWGSGSSDIWAVGDTGTAVHFDGSTWKAVPTGVAGNLKSIWGTGSSDIWAVGTGGASVHFDGTQWLSLSGTGADLQDVWGTSSRDVWAVGNGGVVQRFDGKRWALTPVGTKNWTGIWGSGANEIYLVGDGGVFTSRNGGPFTDAKAPSGSRLVKGMGLDGSSVWVVGDSGRMLLWDGAAWVAGSVTTSLKGPLWGAAADDVYTTDEQHRMWHWDGVRWSPQATSLPMPATPGTLPSFYEYSPSLRFFYWSTGPSVIQIMAWDGALLRMLPEQVTTSGPAALMWASSPADLWVLTTGLDLYRYDGVAWRLFATKAAAFSTLHTPSALFGSSPTDVWVIGLTPGAEGYAYRWDGTKWFLAAYPFAGNGVIPVPGGLQWWSTTPNGTFTFWDGTTRISRGSMGVGAVVMRGGIARTATDIWFAGSAGTLAHFDGTVIKREPSGSDQNLISISAMGPSVLWISGFNLRYSIPK